jgi:hypothetical protein
MNPENFEYDEDVEVDETWEDAETGFEASDEDTEMAEDTEVDEAQDEFYEAAEVDESEAGDEAAEADLEAAEAEVDESDEAARVSASAQLRSDRARWRRERVAQQIKQDQRREIQQAQASQQKIASQVQAIKPGPPPAVTSLAALKGTTLVRATLPNGRSTQMRLQPSLARTQDVNRVRQVMLINERRQAVATRRNSKAISRLANAQASAAKTFSTQLLKGDQDVRKRIVETYKQLDQRITKELSGGSGSMDKHGKRMMAMIRRQRTQSLLQSATLATALPGFAAFGTPGDIKATNNLILTGSLLAYLVAPAALELLSGKGQSTAKTSATWLSYLAPVANPLTVFFLLRNKQHERYISGITTLTGGGGVVTLTKDQIGESSLSDFKAAQHGVVATLVAAGADTVTVRASLTEDKLTFTLLQADGTAATTGGTVAWVIDTETTPKLSPAP